MSDESDISKVFEVNDIFTRKDAISGLKSSPWADLCKLVNTPLDSSNFWNMISQPSILLFRFHIHCRYLQAAPIKKTGPLLTLSFKKSLLLF